MRPVWTMTLAIVLGLVVTGLVDANWYTADHGGAGWLVGTVILALIVLMILARRGEAEIPRVREVVSIAISGVVLTTLFWFRARAGLSGGWLSGIELTLLAMFAWAWPALIPVLLYRRSGEGWRPENRRRLIWLTGTALLVGAFGWVLHLALWNVYEDAGDRQQVAHPLSLHQVITRPTQTPTAIAALGGPRTISPQPIGIVATHPTEADQDPIQVNVTGTLLGMISRDVSWSDQGTRLQSSNPRVIEVIVDDNGRWQLRPGLPGPAIVTVSNRRAQAYIGVWVTNRHGRYAPFEVVTDGFRIEPVSVDKNDDEVFHRQTLRLRNESDRPVLGPIYAVFHTSDSARVAFRSARSTRIEPTGKPWVEALGPSPGNRAPVIGPGQAVDFEILVAPELTREWLHFNVDLIQAFDPP